ncbi:MAG: diphthamide biosynthesis enzyme Dph2 [Candidatus Geothermarchaeales archaeon]
MIHISREEIARHILSRGAKTVLVQAPEGLKPQVSRMIPHLEEKTGSVIILHGDSCFGSCDLGLADGLRMGIDLVVHIGHNPYFGDYRNERLVFIDAYEEKQLNPTLLKQIMELAENRTLGLVASIQYLKILDDVRSFISRNGGRAVVGRASSNVMKPGQVMGCEITTAKTVRNEVDAFLAIGGGDFHALGVALWTGRPTYIADPYKESLVDLTPLARRKLAVVAARLDDATRAERFGVIVGLKEGQMKRGMPDVIASKLEKRGKKVIRLALRELSPERLRYFDGIDCFVQTLCPRISIDDVELYAVPVLSYDQFSILVEEKTFESVYPWD